MANSNESHSFTKLPPNVLDSFFPGYSVISRFLLESFGFDIGILVTVGLLTMALLTSSKYVYLVTYNAFRKYCTSTVYIEQSEDIFVNLMKWISEHKISHTARNVKAVTPWGRADDEWSNGDKYNTQANTSTNASDVLLFNFSLWEIRIPLRFEPYMGRHFFWHEGRIFLIDRYREARASNDERNIRDEEIIAIACVGRSTTPIKALLEAVRVQALQRQETLTAIRRPCPKVERRWSSNPWNRISTRPSRPISTVVLDTDQKIKILSDINEYLHPSTRLWYASRGIPYRRGYLFHGPPGTGKTSLSFALAGIFRLDIFVISLQEPTLTEEDLNSLFSSLPSRCIILLEDIDTAGIKRVTEDDEDEKPKSDNDKFKSSKDKNSTSENKNSDDPKDWTILDVAKALQGANRRDRRDRRQDQGISLSGLLNAIDGVASHEGRILVMTTNHPEKMDEALIRPGRVDMQIAFSLASRPQIREMFIRMYVTDDPSATRGRSAASFNAAPKLTSEKASIPGAASKSQLKASAGLTSTTLTIREACAPPNPATTKCALMPLDELLGIADVFVAKVPEQTFSPAEIQGFLLTRKNDPQRAVAEVEAWVARQAANARAKDVGTEQNEEAGSEGSEGSDGLVHV